MQRPIINFLLINNFYTHLNDKKNALISFLKYIAQKVK